ncbi:diguanylate cyclase [Microbaculum marinum]|uniref:diguanylate cyclase n=1 Tax=Microbaculum marinum TaxID=1764581 RepID=A0AAW9RJ25_9HYPH
MDEALEKLAKLYESTPLLVAVYDSFDRLRYANAAFRSAFFVEPDEMLTFADLMRRNFKARRGTVISVADFEEWLVSTQGRRGKVGYRAFETDLWDGRWFWMTETVRADGWMLCVASDITDLRPDHRAVRQQRDAAIKASYTDDLTGVTNRRFAMARIADMLEHRTGDGQSGCLAILDLDHFKQINDRFGHHTGDMVLRDFTGLVRRFVRRTDCFGRLGGEEFALVLPDTSEAQAVLIIERILSTVRRSRPLGAQTDLAYTFSAGVAAARTRDTVTDLYARADDALYSAKEAGRNRIHIHGAVQGPTTASG